MKQIVISDLYGYWSLYETSTEDHDQILREINNLSQNARLDMGLANTVVEISVDSSTDEKISAHNDWVRWNISGESSPEHKRGDRYYRLSGQEVLDEYRQAILEGHLPCIQTGDCLPLKIKIDGMIFDVVRKEWHFLLYAKNQAARVFSCSLKAKRIADLGYPEFSKLNHIRFSLEEKVLELAKQLSPLLKMVAIEEQPSRKRFERIFWHTELSMPRVWSALDLAREI